MRNPDRNGWWWLISLLCCGLITGCATTPRSAQVLDAAQQAQFLAQLPGFSFTGSIGVVPQGVSAAVDWRQQQALTKAKLSGPLGAGSLRLEFSPASLQLVSSSGKLADADAEQLLVQQLGFLPPFAALRYWVLGVPAPESAAQESSDANGLLQRLEQQGWMIHYERRTAVATRAGTLQLPTKLTATRGEQRLKLVIYRWRLK